MNEEFKYAGMNGPCIIQLRNEYHKILCYTDPKPSPESIARAFSIQRKRIKELESDIEIIKREAENIKKVMND